MSIGCKIKNTEVWLPQVLSCSHGLLSVSLPFRQCLSVCLSCLSFIFSIDSLLNFDSWVVCDVLFKKYVGEDKSALSFCNGFEIHICLFRFRYLKTESVCLFTERELTGKVNHSRQDKAILDRALLSIKKGAKQGMQPLPAVWPG